MRIDLYPRALEAPEKSETERLRQSGSTTGANASAGDQASISFADSCVGRLQAQAMAQPEIRQEKVEALRKAIADNSYRISDDAIADAMARDLRASRQA